MIESIAAIAWGLAVNLMVCAAAVAWHRPLGFTFIVLSTMLSFVSFVAQIAELGRLPIVCLIGLSWGLSLVALWATVALT